MEKRIKQAHISSSIKFFKKDFLQKYSLTERYSESEPLVIFGMYNKHDYNVFENHKGFVIVVWCGSDSMRIGGDTLKIINNKKTNSVHISTHDFGHYDLNKKGVPNIVIPVTPIIEKIQPQPLGDCIYHYGNGKDNFYGDDYLEGIRKSTGLKIIQTTSKTYSKETLLNEIYPQTFIGLRLTKHDGVPTTVIEMGLMGRKCIFNGSVPHNIHWKGLDDICKSIMAEYEKREAVDYNKVSQDVSNFINIGTDWLNISNYR